LWQNSLSGLLLPVGNNKTTRLDGITAPLKTGWIKKKNNNWFKKMNYNRSFY